MAHWAEIDDNNTVVRVLVADDNSHDWLVERLGGTWLQTSYNTRAGVHTLGGTPFRGNYAGVGYSYLEAEDIFMPPKPYESWSLNVETASWVAPIPKPEDGQNYIWDEESTSWTLVE